MDPSAVERDVVEADNLLQQLDRRIAEIRSSAAAARSQPQPVAAPRAAAPASWMLPPPTFYHRAHNDAPWEAYEPAFCDAISAAMRQSPAGGRITCESAFSAGTPIHPPASLLLSLSLPAHTWIQYLDTQSAGGTVVGGFYSSWRCVTCFELTRDC